MYRCEYRYCQYLILEFTKELSMRITNNFQPKMPERVIKLTYSDGRTSFIFRKYYQTENLAARKINKSPPIKTNEPMTKSAYIRTLNRYFEKLIELDLNEENCLFLTLTISDAKHNSYKAISTRFKAFTNKVRFSKKFSESYVGAIRFIEVQRKGFFHIHCVLVFNRQLIKIPWKTLWRMWGWGYIKVKQVNYLIGLFDYLTNAKHGVDDLSKFTLYAKRSKIIYISPNIPKCKSENIEMSIEKCALLFKDDRYIGQAKVHKYFDNVNQCVKTSIDKMVLVQIKTRRQL